MVVNLQQHTKVLTWAAYNSLNGDSKAKTNVGVVAPIIRCSPTQWPGFYTALMRAQHISVNVVGPDSPTIITLDLQLYEKAQKLMSREDMKGKFVFRIGELHTIFSSLKALGRYIEASGIDQVWVEAGMYSPTTVRQILEGKHLYRAMEAHTITLVVMYDLLLKEVWKEHTDECQIIKEMAKEMQQAFDDGPENFSTEVHEKMTRVLEQTQLLSKLQTFQEKYKGTRKFISNYIRQFEAIMQHVRATREGDWRLQPAAQENLNKYFFAHDHLNY